MLDWDDNRDDVLASIGGGSTATLKILLKTKNDHFLLERWIKHHLRIVGRGNVVVFDNGSNEQAVIDIYEKYSNDIQVISFSGFHNNIHYVDRFRDLYGSLAASSKYFVFLDTDEFLLFIKDDRFLDDHRLVDVLSGADDVNVFPATWLYNADWSPTRFKCGPERLSAGLTWGKPILRSGAQLSGYINHNVQLNKSLFGPTFNLNFFVLHLAELIPKQRIAANINKLVSRNFVTEGECPERISAMDLSGITDVNIIQYVSEIRRLLLMTEIPDTSNLPLRAGCLELQDDHSIGYYSQLELELMHDFIGDARKFCRKALDL
jgi:hypothetical protein